MYGDSAGVAGGHSWRITPHLLYREAHNTLPTAVAHSKVTIAKALSLQQRFITMYVLTPEPRNNEPSVEAQSSVPKAPNFKKRPKPKIGQQSLTTLY